MSPQEAWAAFKVADGEVRTLLVSAAAMSAGDRQRQLLVVLNKLELALLQLPDIEPGDEEEQAPSTYGHWREALKTAFPELGLFHMAAPNAEGSEEDAVLHDAHDDLADTLNGLDRFAWFEREQGWENAAWEARFDYETHLGSHISNLRAYVYRLRFQGF